MKLKSRRSSLVEYGSLYPESMVVVLTDQFKIVPDNGPIRACSVNLTDKYLSYRLATFEKANTVSDNIVSDSNVISIPVQDIIGCHVMRSQPVTSRIQESQTYDLERADIASYLVINSYTALNRPRLGVLRQLKRSRLTVVFAVSKGTDWSENFECAERWSKAILWLRKDKGSIINSDPEVPISIPKEAPKQRSLLVLVNPASGPGKAVDIFTQQVSPVLAESGLKYEVMITKAANEAHDYVMNTVDLMTKYDGLVIVSGDGLLYEVINGIMKRDDSDLVIKMPIGIIPGGSGNALAHSINHSTKDKINCNSILASSLNIVSGKVCPMDIVKVTSSNGQVCYSFLSIGWGIIADIDIESERLRAIGGARFTVWGIFRAFALKRYRGKLSYKPLAGYEKAHEPVSKKSIKKSKSVEESKLKREHSVDGFSESEMAGSQSAPVSPIEDMPSPVAFKLADQVKPVEVNLEATANIPCLSEPVPQDWVTIDDEFVIVHAVYQSHISKDCFFAPEARIDDAIIWLLFINGNVNRGQVAQFLIAMDSGTHVDFPFVKMVPVRAFRLEPDSSSGLLTVDGEVIECCPIQAEILPGLARVMTR
ncbi:Sphingosine kinase 2 [Halotydeus destructor]|nr:Sphingosine kinase 2 [Halotydeus destructor]